jgi:hypothetical protein
VSGFTGKRVLFIGIGFYDYEASIVKQLRHYGAIVHAFFDRPAILRRGPSAAIMRRAGITPAFLVHRHEQRILRAIRGSTCDYVLIIKSIDLRPEFLAKLRDSQAQATFILYQWDSLARLPGIERRLPFFDRVLTFDRKESVSRPGLEFRPLFYRDEARILASAEDDARVDLCFIGWLHSDRLGLVRRLQALAHGQRLTFFVYLYTGLFTCARLAFSGEARNVHFRPLGYAELMSFSSRASVIVDLPHPAQSGMTMRAIEAVGLGKKLLTTATDVLQYDFYTGDRVKLLSPDQLNLDREFIRSAVPPLPESVRRRYSLERWLEDVFQLSLAPL